MHSLPLPLLAFQHHVGELFIAPEAIDLVCALGIGDLAVVEQGRWHRPDGSVVNVVVKGWKPDVVATPQDFREMLLEASKLRRLQHPNVTRFLGLGCFSHGSLAEVRESMFMVEEFVSTRTLRKLIGEQMRCRLKNLYDMQSALRWAAQVAAALAALHEQQPPYIHGDVKADNVFMTNSYDPGRANVKLGDLKPHRHVYDRAPSMLSSQQQHHQQQQHSRQGSLARFTLEQLSNAGSRSSSWTSSGSATNARCFLDGPGATADAAAGCEQQAAWQPGRQQLLQHMSSSKSCLEPESPWMAVAAADGDDGSAAPASVAASGRVHSLPVPILRSSSCHAAAAAGAGAGGPGLLSFDSARDDQGFTALEGSCVGSCPGAVVAHGSLQQLPAASPAAGDAAAAAAGAGGAQEAVRRRLGHRALGLSDSASSTSGSDGSVSICKAKLGLVTLADASHQDDDDDGDGDASGDVLLQLQQRAAAEAAAAAAAVAADGQQQQQQQRWRWRSGGGNSGSGSTDKPGTGLRCRSKSLPQQDGLGDDAEIDDQAAAAAAAGLLVTSKSAPACMFASEAAGESGSGREGKVHAGRAMRASQLLLAQQEEAQQPPAAAAMAESGSRSKQPGLLQRQLSAGDAVATQLRETALQQPRRFDTHPSLTREPSLERQQQQQAASSVGRGWELSPSGAASPCGAVQCGLLDLFADMTDDDVVCSRRVRDVSLTQYALMPGSLVQHRLQPAATASQLRAAQSWEPNSSNSGACALAPFSSLPQQIGSSSSSSSGLYAVAAAGVAPAPAAALPACKGSAPSAIESKQHGGNSAFAALTAIDCITEETSSIATDSVMGSCCTSRESTAHGGSHYYRDAPDSSHSSGGGDEHNTGAAAGKGEQAQQPPSAVSAAAIAASVLARSYSPATPQQRSAFGMSALLPARSASGSGCSLEGVKEAAGSGSSNGDASSDDAAAEQAAATPVEAAAGARSSSSGAGDDDSPKQHQAAPAAGPASPGPGKRVRFTVERPAGSTPSRDFGLLYTAPELLRGQRPTEKVDVFAFGVLLHELLSRQLVVSRISQVCAAASGKHSRSRGRGGSRHGGGSRHTAAAAAAAASDEAAEAAADSANWDAPDALPEQQLLLSFAQLVAGGFRLPFPAHFPEAARKLIAACWAAEPHERPRMSDVLLQLQELAADRPAVAQLNSYLAGLADMGYGSGARHGGSGSAGASCGCSGGCVIC